MFEHYIFSFLLDIWIFFLRERPQWKYGNSCLFCIIPAHIIFMLELKLYASRRLNIRMDLFSWMQISSYLVWIYFLGCGLVFAWFFCQFHLVAYKSVAYKKSVWFSIKLLINFINKRLQYRCFPVNICWIFDVLLFHFWLILFGWNFFVSCACWGKTVYYVHRVETLFNSSKFV